MYGAAAGAQLEPENAARRQAQAVVGRLAVDQKSHAIGAGRLVRRSRAVAPALLADDEHQADARLAVTAQLLGRRDLRRKNPFRVAGPTPEQLVAFDPAGKERRHAVEMSGENHGGAAAFARADLRNHVEAGVVDALLVNRPAAAAEIIRQPSAALAFAAGRRIDVDQSACETNDIDQVRRHADILSTTCNGVATGSTLRAPCGCRCASRGT